LLNDLEESASGLEGVDALLEAFLKAQHLFEKVH
jgi:hypothetical protein